MSGLDEPQNVVVAVKIRPLVASEVEQGSRSCLKVTPGVPQVSTGTHIFSYDQVYSDEGQDPDHLYPQCVAPLIEGLFRGYNATVFAYGQTGSGKTWTMGSEYRPGSSRSKKGVIPEAINAIFAKIATNQEWETTVRVSFVEIHKEEVRDLLVTNVGPRTAVSIREVPGGGVSLAGAIEKDVKSEDEMVSILELGTLCRATASTNMNNRSSRSHAIFTITLEQRRQLSPSTPGQFSSMPGNCSSSNSNGMKWASQPGTGGREDDEEDEDGGLNGPEFQLEDFLVAKMHLVDLAGSERAKRTKAEGARLKEGIHINRGLLALGNVINAIVDNHKHVPYRDSKLTRLLQDSLGGNSRTVMIACVSPADINHEESLNTLRYADRARHIRNKPVINRDPIAAEVASLRQQLSQVKGENLALRKALGSDGREIGELDRMLGYGGTSYDHESGSQWALTEALQRENGALELENTRIKMQMEDVQTELGLLSDRCCTLQSQLDVMHATAAMPDRDEAMQGSDQGVEADGKNRSPSMKSTVTSAVDSVLKKYLARIADLERELKAARQFQGLRRRTATIPGCYLADGSKGGSVTPLPPGMQTPHAGADEAYSPRPSHQHEGQGIGSPLEGVNEAEEFDGDEEVYYAEMAAHALEQEKMKQEMLALQRTLEVKERKMSELMAGTGQVPALKQHYDRVLTELQRERDALVNEKAVILQKLAHITAISEEERRKLESGFKERLAAADEKLRALRHKEREFVHMQKLKHQTEDICKRLSSDIQRIKLQKVALQRSLETGQKEFQLWRTQREKELLQLRRQNRRNAMTIQTLEAMQAKHNAVLQRKIADANAARKKLRELQMGGGGGSSGANGNGNHGMGGRHALASNQAQQAAAAAGSSANAAKPGGAIRTNSGAPAPQNPTALNGAVEMQPNAEAPLLRTEHMRREWLEKELDMCNQSYEYRRVLEGELAQRADINRQLRDVVKRLMLSNNLVPASPLLAALEPGSNPQSGPTVLSPGAVGDSDAVRARLLERKAQLEKTLEEHNDQIGELQNAWERSKLEEEGKGGGAADIKRWGGIRNIVEARDLLRSVFRAASDQRSMSNDMQLECVKLGEEVELLRVQLDAARKEAEAQRKRAAAIEVTAATAMATPYGADAGSGTPFAHNAADDTVREVDALLQRLQAAKTPGCVPYDCDQDEANMELASPDGSVHVSLELRSGMGPGENQHTPGFQGQQNVNSPGLGSRGEQRDRRGLEAVSLRLARAAMELDAKGVGKRLAVLKPQKCERYLPSSSTGVENVPEDEDLRQKYQGGNGHTHAKAEGGTGNQSEDETFLEEEVSSDEDRADDEDWDPACASVPRRGRRSSAVPASVSSAKADGGPAHERPAGGRRGSKQQVRQLTELQGAPPSFQKGRKETPEADMMMMMISSQGGESSAPNTTAHTFASVIIAGGSERSTSHISSRRCSSNTVSAQSSGLSLGASDAPILEAINQARSEAGLLAVEKLTVKVLKEALVGRVMPDGKTWKAGSKTKDQLLSDARVLFYVPVLAVERDNALGPVQEEERILLEPSHHSDSRSLMQASLMGSSLLEGQGGGGGGRNYRSVLLLPPSPSLPHPHLRPNMGQCTLHSPVPSALSPTSPSNQAHGSENGWREEAGGGGKGGARTRSGHARPSPSYGRGSHQELGFAQRSPGGKVTGSYTPMTPQGDDAGQGAGSFLLQQHLQGEGGWGRGVERSVEGSGGKSMTPLSLLYIQKAQEARERTALLRQSMSKAAANSPKQMARAVTSTTMPGTSIGPCVSPRNLTSPRGGNTRHSTPRSEGGPPLRSSYGSKPWIPAVVIPGGDGGSPPPLPPRREGSRGGGTGGEGEGEKGGLPPLLGSGTGPTFKVSPPNGSRASLLRNSYPSSPRTQSDSTPLSNSPASKASAQQQQGGGGGGQRRSQQGALREAMSPGVRASGSGLGIGNAGNGGGSGRSRTGVWK